MATAKVPQIPATRCTEIAPTTSSIFNLSSNGIANVQITPPIAPIMIACNGVATSGPAVIETNPARAPFKTNVKSVLLYKIIDKTSAATKPAQAAILVFT